jgi:uncharacterized repeat protein (TIGR01451 family)
MKCSIFFICCYPLLLFSQFADSLLVQMSFPYLLRTVAIGDIDQDGLDDMVFSFDWNLSWSKNLDGMGAWSANQAIDLEYKDLRQVRLADMDGDGYPDIVAIHDGNNSVFVKWYKNLGNGTFSAPILIHEHFDGAIGTRKLSIELGDIDNDGHTDIVAAFDMTSGSADRVVWYKNLMGTGNFSPPITIAANLPNPLFVKIAHLNNDAFPDILLASGANAVIVIKNLDGAGFAAPDTIATINGVLASINAGDLDGDGDLDIFAGTTSLAKVLWFQNIDNTGNFGPEQSLAGNLPFTSSILAADLDGDMDADIIYISGGAGKVGYLENLDGAGSFGPPINLLSVPSHPAVSTLTVADLDQDMNLDIIATGSSTESYFILYNTDGAGNFEQTESLNTGPYNVFPRKIRMGDIDGDGYPDAVVGGEPPYRLAWLRYNPEFHIFEKPRNIDVPSYTLVLQIALVDLNNDGHLDILYHEGKTDLGIRWVLNDGAGNFSPFFSVPYSGLGSGTTIYTDDLNLDGYQDIIVSGKAYPGWGVYWYENLGDAGGFAPPVHIYADGAVDWITIADLDGDNYNDIIPIFTYNKDLGWIKNNGGSYEPWALLKPNSSSALKEILVYDWNQDGLQDILAINASKHILYYKASSYATFDNPVSKDQNISNLSNLNLVDYNLDGLMDLVFVSGGNKVYWVRNTNNSNLFSAKEEIDLGLSNYALLSFEDIDGDGDKDLIYGIAPTYLKFNIASNGKIVARSYYDENSNGIFDQGEHLLDFFPFSLNPNQTTFFSTMNGASQFFVPEGTYILNSTAAPGWHLSSDSSSYTIEFVEEVVFQRDFGYFPDSLYSHIIPDLTSGPTRCGFTVPFWLTSKNAGTLIENGRIGLHVEKNATFLESAPPPDSISNDTLFWSVSSLLPTHSAVIDLLFEIADAAFLGDSVRMSVIAYSYDSPAGAAQFVSEIVCAYDPNDKLVTPEGYLEERFTLFGEELEYTIRFQNTGNDTAFHVRITDLLDPALDLTTFRVIACSHPMETSLHPFSRLLTFSFPDILLPDSTTNEPLSHGFAKYRIAHKNGLPEGVVVENYANIFFDFNPAIKTNTTWNTLVTEYPFQISSQVQEPLCHGDSTGFIELDVYAIPPVAYAWSLPGLTGPVAASLSAGTFQVTLTDGVGGAKTQEFILSEPPPLTAGLSSTPQSGAGLGSATAIPLGGTPPYLIVWGTDPSQEGETAVELTAGNYSVTISDANGCLYSGSIEVMLESAAPERKNGSIFTIFPNPSNGQFSIHFDSGSVPEFKLTITDISGTPIFEVLFQQQPNGNIPGLQNLELPSGIYFLSIFLDGQVRHYEKLIIMR